jgi:hypothetical protein
VGFFGRKAEPLDASDVAEYPTSELHEMDGRTYLRDDLYWCDGCKKPFRERSDLDDECLCVPCAEEADEDARGMERERRWARWACR